VKRAVGRGGRLGPAAGTQVLVPAAKRSQGSTTGESSSSSKRLAQPGEEISTLPARNYSLRWHGQEEKCDGKQRD